MPIAKKTDNILLGKPEFGHQSWMQLFYRNTILLDLWLEQLRRGNQVISGGVLTLNGNDVDLNATEVEFGGTFKTFSLGVQTPIVGLSTGITYLVYVDNSGTLTVTAITNTSLWTQALPSDLVLIGLVFEIEQTTQGVKEWVISNAPNLSVGPSARIRQHIADHTMPWQNLAIKNNATNPNYQVDIDADFIAVEGWRFGSVNLTADITASGANGLDTGAEAASTWYHVWAIANVSDPAAPVIAGLLSLQYPGSGSDPTLPAGYTKKLYLGAVYNKSISDFESLQQLGNRVVGSRTAVLSAGTSGSTVVISLASAVPQTARHVSGDVRITDKDGGARNTARLKPTSALLGEKWFTGNQVNGVFTEWGFEFNLAESQNLYYSSSTSGTLVPEITIFISGWRY